MKKSMFNYSKRMEDVLYRAEIRDSYTICALDRLMHENKHYRIICENQLRACDPNNEIPELDLAKGFTDFEMYHNLMRSVRLLSLVGRKPQEFMNEEAEFLFGCPFRFESFSDDEIDSILSDQDLEAIDDESFYYVWIIFGAYDEVKMAVKVNSESGTVHPLPFIPIQSEFSDQIRDKKFLTYFERNILIDRIFYPINIPDEINSDDTLEYDDEEEWVEDIDEDDEEWFEETDEDDEEWVEDIDEDDEEWFEETDEDDEEWVEDIDEDDEEWFEETDEDDEEWFEETYEDDEE